MSLVSNENTRRFVFRPLTVGAVGAGVAMLLDPRSPPINILGMKVPAPLGFGILTAGASEVTEILHKFIFPRIPVINKFNKMESAILLPIMGGISYWGILKLTQPQRIRGIDINVLLIGGASVTAGEYFYNMIIDPALRTKRQRALDL